MSRQHSSSEVMLSITIIKVKACLIGSRGRMALLILLAVCARISVQLEPASHKTEIARFRVHMGSVEEWCRVGRLNIGSGDIPYA
jgi:hypothetical protein